MLQLDTPEKLLFAKNSIKPQLVQNALKFNQSCRNLYKSYSDMIVQGSLFSKDLHMLVDNWKANITTSTGIEEFLFFNKIKYRRDMRQIREEWMLRIMKDGPDEEELLEKYPMKRMH